MTVPITVAIPVGPYPSNQRWLTEAIESVARQTLLPSEVLLIEDGCETSWIETSTMRIYRTPWRVGVASAFNFGVALAKNDLVIMMGSDDKLYPDCLALCWETWQMKQDPHAYYALMLEYPDGHQQDSPCNAAMVHKALWKRTGGFPPEAGVGICDHFVLGLLQIAPERFGTIEHVIGGPHYFYRNHSETDTERRRAQWHNLAFAARNLYIEERTQ